MTVRWINKSSVLGEPNNSGVRWLSSDETSMVGESPVEDEVVSDEVREYNPAEALQMLGGVHRSAEDEVYVYNPAEALMMMGRAGKLGQVGRAQVLGAVGGPGAITPQLVQAFVPSVVKDLIARDITNKWTTIVRAAFDGLGFGVIGITGSLWRDGAAGCTPGTITCTNDGAVLKAFRAAVGSTSTSFKPSDADVDLLAKAIAANKALGSSTPVAWHDAGGGIWERGAPADVVLSTPPGGLTDIISTVLSSDLGTLMPTLIPATSVAANQWDPADWQLRLIQLNRMMGNLIPGFGADGSKDFTWGGLSSVDWQNVADRTVQAYRTFEAIPEVAAAVASIADGNTKNSVLYSILALPTQSVVGDDVQSKALINAVNGAVAQPVGPVTPSAGAIKLNNGQTFDPVTVAADWKQWVNVDCPSDPATLPPPQGQGLTCIADRKIRTVKLVQEALLEGGFNPKGILGGQTSTVGKYVIPKRTVGPGVDQPTSVTEEMNGTGAGLGPREQKGGRWWTATRIAWNQMAVATGSKILGAEDYKNFGVAEFQALASKVQPGVQPPAAATLVSVTVNPSSATLQIPGVQSFTATANFDDGSKKDVTNLVLETVWTSSDPLTAPVAAGKVTGLKASATPVTITATYKGKSGSAKLTVNAAAPTAATVVSVSVDPSNPPPLQIPGVQLFTATATFSDGSKKDVTNLLLETVWTSSDPLTAPVVAGKVTGLKASSTPVTITATYQGKSGSASLTVSGGAVVPPPPPIKTLVSVVVTPPPAIPGTSFTVGKTQQFKATAAYSDASTEDVTNTATWQASNANVTVSKGLVTAVTAGSSSIKASFQGKDSLPVTITVSSGGAGVPCTIPTQIRGQDGICRCPTGTQLNAAATECVDITKLPCPQPMQTRNAKGDCVFPAIPNTLQYSDADFQLRLAAYNRFVNPGKLSPVDFGGVCKHDIRTGPNDTACPPWAENPWTLLNQGFSLAFIGPKTSTVTALTPTTSTVKPTFLVSQFAAPQQKLAGTPGMLGDVVETNPRTNNAFLSYLSLKGLLDGPKGYKNIMLSDGFPMAYNALVADTQTVLSDPAKVAQLLADSIAPCPAKTCSPDQQLNADGTGCIPKQPTCDPKTQFFDTTLNKCMPIRQNCAPGYQKDPSGAIDPSTGQVKCIPIPCPKGQWLKDPAKGCEPIVCPEGQRMNADQNGCEPIPRPSDQTCPEGKVPGANGDCVPKPTPVTKASAGGGGDNALGILALLAGAGALAFLAFGKSDDEQKPGAKGTPGSAGMTGIRPAAMASRSARPAAYGRRPSRPASTGRGRRARNPYGYKF